MGAKAQYPHGMLYVTKWKTAIKKVSKGEQSSGLDAITATLDTNHLLFSFLLANRVASPAMTSRTAALQKTEAKMGNQYKSTKTYCNKLINCPN